MTASETFLINVKRSGFLLLPDTGLACWQNYTNKIKAKTVEETVSKR